MKLNKFFNKLHKKSMNLILAKVKSKYYHLNTIIIIFLKNIIQDEKLIDEN